MTGDRRMQVGVTLAAVASMIVACAVDSLGGTNGPSFVAAVVVGVVLFYALAGFVWLWARKAGDR